MAYIGGAPAAGCLFCLARSAGDDPRHLVLHRGSHAFLILNAYPYTPGHLMAVVNRHVATVPEASDVELTETMRLVGTATTVLRAEYRAEGFNIGINEGRVLPESLDATWRRLRSRLGA
jgi:ATP adenylyltransferase